MANELQLSRPRLTDLIAECQSCGWTMALRDAAPSTIMEAARWHARSTVPLGGGRGHEVGYSRTTLRLWRARG